MRQARRSFASSVSRPVNIVMTGVDPSLTAADIDSLSLTYAKLTDPSHGTVIINPDGTFTYTPTANYGGPDAFTFRASDGSLD